jgi:SAM-dependent methyltransferase
MTKKILDPCCGSKMFWADKHHPDVIFGDIRREHITVTDRSHGKADGIRTLQIEPDTIMDFRALPFSDNTFALVSFDPPHLVRAGPRSWLAAKYGKLGPNWREDIKRGFEECLRVLKPDGTLIFKWCETQVATREVLELAPIQPLFGHLSGRKGLTHWLVFMKPANEET